MDDDLNFAGAEEAFNDDELLKMFKEGGVSGDLLPFEGGQSGVIAPPEPLMPRNEWSNTSTRSVAVPWEDLQLIIRQHSVHKVEEDELNGEKIYVVSNLRKFKIEVALVYRDGLDAQGQAEPALDNRLELRAVLLYENGCVVKKSTEDEQLLLGETEVVIIKGEATFKLQMGPSILSSKMGKQNFRIKIEPVQLAIAEQNQQLIVLTEPLKSVTKLERKPPPPRGYDEPGASPFSAPSLPPLGQASQLSAALPRPGNAGPGCHPSQSHTGNGSSLFPTGNEGSAGGDSVSSLSHTLSTERQQQTQISEVVRQQKAQIAQLTQANAEIMQEMQRLRRMLTDGQPGGSRQVAARSVSD